MSLLARRAVENGIGERTPRTFSALLCNFNHAEFIEQAITSVVGQSRRPDEYLILDDGSSDGSMEIISRYAAKYPFIKVIRKTRNEGLTKGMNELIRLATSDFIHFGSADDYMLPGFIENAMLLAEQNPQVGIITGVMTIESEATGAVQHLGIPNWKTGFIAPEKYLHEYLEVGDPTCVLSASTILRREAVIEMGSWRENLGIWHVSFAIQACALKYGMCYLDMPCYTWVYRRKGLTHRSNIDVSESIAVYTNYLELICSPDFRRYFSDKFARMWFAANVEMTARTFAVERAEDVVVRRRQDSETTQLRPAA